MIQSIVVCFISILVVEIVMWVIERNESYDPPTFAEFVTEQMECVGDFFHEIWELRKELW